ncbi:MAG: hypothetical protein NTW50_00900 [Candidatus Berkelbacteria bacterium]|nr:hypothetical protein [Candidatus Berkelbacteria bacterium]
MDLTSAAETFIEIDREIISPDVINWLNKSFAEFIDSVGFNYSPDFQMVNLSIAEEGQMKMRWTCGGPIKFAFWVKDGKTRFNRIKLPVLERPGEIEGALPSGARFILVFY